MFITINKRLFFLSSLIFIFCRYIIEAQSITVLDKETLHPIENVYAYNSHSSGLTDNKGKVMLDKLEKDEYIYFQHATYDDLKITQTSLENAQYEILLTQNIINVDEVLISANKWSENKSNISNKIIAISANEVAFNNPMTSAEMLSSSNEVYIQKSQLGGGSPMIRGFAANRVLIVVDGVRMNNAIYRSGNLQNVISLDPNSIKSTEVIFGPGSIMYGSDAIGGVMNFYTNKPKLSANDSILFYGNTLARYSTSSSERTGHVNFNVSRKKIGLFSSVSYSIFDDLIMGKNLNNSSKDYTRKEYVNRMYGMDTIIKNKNIYRQVESGYSQLNIMQKITYAPNDKLEFNYGFHFSTLSNVPRYDRLTQYKNKTLKYAEWYYGPQKWMMNSLGLSYTGRSLLFDKINYTAAFQEYNESRHDRKYQEVAIRERFETVNIISSNLDLKKDINEDISLGYGIETVYNKVYSKGQIKNIETEITEPYSSRYPNNSYLITNAAYTNFKYTLNPKLCYNLGLRFNSVITHADFDTVFYKFPFEKIDIYTQAFNWSTGITFKPKKEYQFNFNAASGFRAPNIDDIGKVFDSEPGVVVVPNENLKPEYVYNFEFGFLLRFNTFFEINASLFYSTLNNAIVRNDFNFNNKDSILYDGTLSKVEALTNTDKANIYGSSFGIQSNITQNFLIISKLTYTKGYDQNEIPLQHVTPLFGASHFIFKTDKIKFDLFAVYNGKISNENLAPSEQSKSHMYAKDDEGMPFSPAWWTLNIKAGYQISNFINIYIGIENILDKGYRPYASGIAASGRNLSISTRIKF